MIGKERRGTLEFCKIKKLPSERLVTFVERLTRAIALQVKNEGAQEQLLEEMALADANEQCKAAILSLSIELALTLHDMLQVCARKIPFIKAHQNHSSRDKLPQKAAAAAAVDINNLPIRLEHLCGDGEWVTALKQAQEIPLAVLERIKDAALKAFFSIQPDGSFQPYSKIKQLPSEPFVTFLERLT
ncbi:hypothetical protein DUI87_12690 [Hirundo rustica rustica]|uniref:Retroviral nucleocapsid Gag protein p24 C-terminal domain-containing protein n=1 Tax=Hirundo rustica rustica TaxID=333673 RepID=A0A3M0K9P2_HIRRU|nr:hypothetical protein DUI87_12690 [Hirundo rustica rustica]